MHLTSHTMLLPHLCTYPPTNTCNAHSVNKSLILAQCYELMTLGTPHAYCLLALPPPHPCPAHTQPLSCQLATSLSSPLHPNPLHSHSASPHSFHSYFSIRCSGSRGHVLPLLNLPNFPHHSQLRAAEATAGWEGAEADVLAATRRAEGAEAEAEAATRWVKLSCGVLK